MEYIVINVKSFQGREGYGFECSLYKDGKRIGTVTETADGGPTDFYLNDGEKEILNKYCTTLPHIKFSDDCEKMAVDADIFIGQLVNQFDMKQQQKRWCRTQTIFRIKGDKEGEYRTLKNRFDDKVKVYLEKKYAGKELVIINEKIG